MPELDYEFINNYTVLKASDNLMSRAVRVKTSVKDKLERVYSKVPSTLVTPVSDVKVEEKAVVSEKPVVKEVSLSDLIDNSSESLSLLNEKLNALHNQNNAGLSNGKAVLFTKPLVDKISNMSNTWIKIEDKKEHIIPGEWDKVEVENTLEAVSKEETVEKPVEVVETKTEENVIGDALIPVNVEEKDLDSNIAIPSFEASPVVNETLIPEPNVLPQTIEKVEPVESPKQVSIEDKIAELLNRKNEMQTEKSEVVKVNEEPVNEVKDKKMVDATQTTIMAKLQRLNNTMKEKSAENAMLKSKIEALNETLADTKEKNSSIMDTVEYLTSKNKELSLENEKLSNNSLKTEYELRGKVSNLEGQLSFLKQSSKEKREEMYKMNSDLKAKYEEDLEKLRKEKDKEMAEKLAKKDKQIQAIYATIADALGENFEFNDLNDKSMSA